MMEYIILAVVFALVIVAGYATLMAVKEDMEQNKKCEEHLEYKKNLNDTAKKDSERVRAMRAYGDWNVELIDQARQEIEQKDKKNEKLYKALFISLMVNTMLSVVIWWGVLFYTNVIMKLIG